MLNYTMGKMKEFDSAIDDGETESNKDINTTGDYTIKN